MRCAAYRRIWAVAVVVGAVILLINMQAWAHAVLLESRPVDGTRLKNSPSGIVLQFNEPIIPIRVRVLDRSGRELGKGEAAAVHGNSIRIGLPTPLPDGGYMVSYRVTSADSHPVAGTILFAVGAPSEPPKPPAAALDEGASIPWLIAARINRAVHYVGLLLALGGGLFLLCVARGAWKRSAMIRRQIEAAAGVAAVTAILSVGFQGVVLLGPDANEWADAWRIGAHSTAGLGAAIVVSGVAILAFGLRVRREWTGNILIAIGAAVAAGSFGVTGHAATAFPQWLMGLIVAVHVAVAAFWAGSLISLLAVLRQPGAAPTIERFSRIAIAAAVVLVLAGGVLAVRHVEGLAALFSTAYGWTLLSKLGFVATLLGIAAFNKFRLTPALAAGDGKARVRLMRSIRVELAVFSIVVAITAALGAMAPPRVGGAVSTHTEHHRVGMHVVQTVVVGIYRAMIEVASDGVGGHAITVRFDGADDAPLNPKEVTGIFALSEAGIEPIARPFERVSPGIFRHHGIVLSPPGQWKIVIEALITEFEKATFAAEFSVP